jgi:hypothetical protein
MCWCTPQHSSNDAHDAHIAGNNSSTTAVELLKMQGSSMIPEEHKSIWDLLTAAMLIAIG